jgi:tetratricopeptide (TPR) repeat protein
MNRTRLSFLFLAVLCASVATGLEPWFQSWAGNRAQSANLLQVALGDGRKLFARHFFLKGDAYFHNGYYPTIFDETRGFENAHLTEQAGHREMKEGEEETSFLGEPRDWIDAFNRHFYPSRHSHLGESPSGPPNQEGLDGNQDHRPKGAGAPSGLQREILPWLRLAADLDPQRVGTFVVGAYWLRRELHKPHEAEAFLREGLRANPGNHELLFEMGRIYFEEKKDLERARDFWELALRGWEAKERGKEDANTFLYAQILGNLGRLEEEEGNYRQATVYLEKLKTVSPNAGHIQAWIDELRKKSKSL